MKQTKKRKEKLYGHIHVRSPNPLFWQVLKKQAQEPSIHVGMSTVELIDKIRLNSVYGKVRTGLPYDQMQDNDSR